MLCLGLLPGSYVRTRTTGNIILVWHCVATAEVQPTLVQLQADQGRVKATALVITSRHVRHVAERIESGTCFVNQISWTYASMPMGGVKKSGYGRELADLGIMEFVNQKLISVFDKDHVTL